MNRSAKYLVVTGANGYLGKYVILEAISRGYHVIGFVYDHIRSTRIQHPNVSYIYCDITKEIARQPGVANAVANKKVVGIVNAAALLGSSDYDLNHEVNAEGVRHMIRFAKEQGIEKFVQISSVVVLKKIKGPYGITKLKGQEFVEKSGLNYTIFIPAMILGPESLGINRILKNVYRFPLFVPLIGKGRQTQHPVFVKDFAGMIIASIENPASRNKTYKIAGDTVIAFRDLISMILKINKTPKIMVPVPIFVASWLGKFFQRTQKVPVFTAEHVKGILQDSNLNTELLKKDLDFVPTPLQDALTYTLAEIGSDWQKYLTAREEETIEPDLLSGKKSEK